MKFKRILIGIDDTKYSKHAAEYGFELAHTFNAAVALVNIVAPAIIQQPADPSMLGAFIPSFTAESTEVENIQHEYSKKLLDDMVATLGKGLEVTTFSQLGPTAQSIIDCAAEFRATLIVVGTHRRHGLDRLIMGSVAEHVLRHSPIPVLVVPTDAGQHE